MTYLYQVLLNISQFIAHYNGLSSSIETLLIP